MTDTGDLSQLEELEPLADAGPVGEPTAPRAQPVRITGGLPAPAYNPEADTEYYRFLFAGVVMLLGCLMPFGPDQALVGYKTPSGAFFTLIALGIIWSSWASIHHRRMAKGLLRWIGLAFLPFLLGIVDLIGAFEAPAVQHYVASNPAAIGSWSDFFSSLGTILYPDSQLGEFLHHYGTGRIGVFMGALLAELFMVMAVFGGAKKISEQKAERRAAATSGRRRG